MATRTKRKKREDNTTLSYIKSGAAAIGVSALGGAVYGGSTGAYKGYKSGRSSANTILDADKIAGAYNGDFTKPSKAVVKISKRTVRKVTLAAATKGALKGAASAVKESAKGAGMGLAGGLKAGAKAAGRGSARAAFKAAAKSGLKGAARGARLGGTVGKIGLGIVAAVLITKTLLDARKKKRSSKSESKGGPETVSAYTRSDGTRVSGYTRSN